MFTKSTFRGGHCGTLGSWEAWTRTSGQKDPASWEGQDNLLPPHPPDVKKWPQKHVSGRCCLRNLSPLFFFSSNFAVWEDVVDIAAGDPIPQSRQKNHCKNSGAGKFESLQNEASFCKATTDGNCHAKEAVWARWLW